MKRSHLAPPALAASTLLIAAAASAQPAAPPDPLVRAGATEPVSAHAYVILDQNVGLVPNVGFVVGEDAVLVIDTGLGERNGETVLAEAQALAPDHDLYIVSTHFHPEHDLGAQAFPDSAQVIRSEDQIAEIAESGEANIELFSGFSAAVAELLDGARHRDADIVFDDELTLDLGGLEVRIIAMGPNHTLGDTAVFVPSESVLYAGDVAMSRPPAFASPHSSLRQWLASLERYDALDPAVIVPAHGPLGDESFIAGYRDYLTAVRERTAARKAEGLSVDDTVPAVTADLEGSYETGRMAGAIRVAYAEAP